MLLKFLILTLLLYKIKVLTTLLHFQEIRKGIRTLYSGRRASEIFSCFKHSHLLAFSKSPYRYVKKKKKSCVRFDIKQLNEKLLHLKEKGGKKKINKTKTDTMVTPQV